MSAEKRRLEGERWLLQAEDDLEAGRALLAAGKHAQAAFMAQQAGEKGLKGLWLALGLDPWGHSLARLVKDLPGEEGDRLRPLLPLALDKLHIPTRYPDALLGLIPKEAYTREEAKEALAQAQALLARIRQVLGEG
ncbi:HEPN domain-containing protein [Thermus thermamylovorans]|uniref:HEPN domain-containing protein n=1 Tax=Thermus thermamylovorans TaxID=2509362 RepID=A0A4Q9B8K9_9DEIN|nr:HEPN domain-containing protein [Thermus thermamylovorans]TBH21218.1 HEPN domain-containing protein [Thermus thermamylovorans]